MAQTCPVQTVFDILQTEFSAWQPIAFGLAFAAVGFLLIIAPVLMKKILPGGLQGKARFIFSLVFLAFSLTWTYANYESTYPEYERLKKAAANGQGKVVEGKVEKFHPMPIGGHDTEHFEINGERFAYSDYSYTGGYNRTASRGGTIREGLSLRITHVDNIIVKIEFALNGCFNPV